MSGIRYKLIIGLIIILPCLLIIAFSVHAQESFLNEPPFDSPPIESSNPITPSTLTIADITSSSAALTWTKNTDADFAYYLVLRITSLVPPAGIPIAQISDRNQTSFTDTLPQGTTYYYQIRTYNQAGQFSRSNTLGALYVSYADITVDGSVSDWSGLNISIQDYTNDKQPGSPLGTDISNVYLAHDNQYFYARMDLADGPPNIQDVVYYSITFDSRQEGPIVGDKYLRSQFFPGPEQNQSILRQRTSIDPPQAITIATDIAARGTNTLEMRTPLDKLNGGLLYFYVNASAVPGPVGYYDGTIQMVIRLPKIYPYGAVELAKEILGAPYLGDGETWGGKGEDCNQWPLIKFVSPAEIIVAGYNYWHNTEGKCLSGGKGLDCSGVSFWSYNRAFYGDKIAKRGECLAYFTTFPKCPVAYDGGDDQYRYNSYEITRDQLKPGDLLFFNPSGEKNKRITHVAMYIGNNEVIEASFSYGQIIKDTLDGIIARLQNIVKLVVFSRVSEPKTDSVFKGKSSGYSIDLVITDPEGVVITKEIFEAPGLYYREYDLDEDGRLEDFVSIPERKIGDYLIQVVPESDALPADTYTLETETLINGEVVTQTLAKDIPISDIPRTPYIIKSTKAEIIPVIPAFIDFNPDALNLKSKGEDVTVYIELPKNYNINEIDLKTIKLNNQVPIKPKPIAIGNYDKNGIPDLMVKFDRAAVKNILTAGDKIKITISGKLNDGRLLEGSDTIKVINTKSVTFLIPLALLSLLGLIGNKWKKFRLFNKNKTNEGKSTILIIVLIGILFSITVILGYQLWKERAKNMKLTQSIMDLTKKPEELIKTNFFKECSELKLLKRNQGPISVQLLGVSDFKSGRRIWNLFVVDDAKGETVGFGLPLESSNLRIIRGADVNDDGLEDVAVGIRLEEFTKKMRDFLIIITPDEDTSSTDTYSLQLLGGPVLAKNVSYSLNQLDHIYILRQTEDGIIPIVPMSIGCRF